MPPKKKTKESSNPVALPPGAKQPPNWPAFVPLVPEADLVLSEVAPRQIVTIPNLWTATLCKSYVSFLSSLPLTTTPGKPKKGDAVRVNDRYQIDDPAFAERLWSETALKALITGTAEGTLDLTDAQRKELWGGEVVGLNPNIRIYRYSKGQFFDQHYDDSNNVIIPRSPSIPARTTWTLLLYLTSPATGCVGGETVFYPDPPRKKTKEPLPEPFVTELEVGLALLHRHGADCMLHEGREVLQGEKWGGKHRGLGVHISFVRSVTMDSWSEIQLKKMESGGNEKLNQFLSQYGVVKETDIVTKYNTNAASIYRDRTQALAEGRRWRDPPVVKESVAVKNKKPPLSAGAGGRNGSSGGNGEWDTWDNFDNGGFRSASDVRRNQSVGDFRSGGGGGGVPSRSKSTLDIYTRAQLEASAAGKEDFFARRMAENDSRPEGLAPSQGGKYVGFGSAPAQMPRNNSQGDVLSAVTQGFGRLSMVAASAAQSAATVVQAGTKDLTSKVREGGYDYKVNETVNVVTAKTSEIGQKTWGIMKGVMALASQKVEEYTKEGCSGWKNDGWQNNETQGNGYYQEFGQESKGGNSTGGGQSSSGGHVNSVGSGSWDDWDSKDNQKEASTKGTGSHNGDSWAGWDDAKDDGYDSFYQKADSNKAVGHNGKSNSNWTGGGFI